MKIYLLGAITAMMGCGLAACGSAVSASPSQNTSPGNTPISAPSATPSSAKLPQACALLSSSQVSRILGLPVGIGKQSARLNGGTQCSFTDTKSSLTSGLGSTALVVVNRAPVGSSRSQYYQADKSDNNALNFQSVTVNGMPALAGFGGSQIELYLGEVVLQTQIVNTYQASSEKSDSIAIAGLASTTICRKISCVS